MPSDGLILTRISHLAYHQGSRGAQRGWPQYSRPCAIEGGVPLSQALELSKRSPSGRPSYSTALAMVQGGGHCGAW